MWLLPAREEAAASARAARATQFLQRDECDEDLGREMSMFFCRGLGLFAAHVAAERDA